MTSLRTEEVCSYTPHRQLRLSKLCPTQVGQSSVLIALSLVFPGALLTVYDMCKAVDRGMTITGVRVDEKRGGKSGDWVAQP